MTQPVQDPAEGLGDTRVEVYGSPPKMLASVLLSLLIAFTLFGVWVSAARHHTHSASVGQLMFAICLGLGYVAVVVWVNRLAFKRLAENSIGILRGKPIYVLTPRFISFLDVFEVQINNVIDVKEVDLSTGGIPGYGKKVVILITRSEIHLGGNSLERRSYESKIGMLISTARQRKIELSERRVVLMDLSGTNFGTREIYTTVKRLCGA
ncbi:UNVERIFIED_ORG: hypothetical protein J2Y81_003432 [Paraburkholderia sediminicola]|jgi:hypothetical protein|uniref:hypothetical protein n=1 Tax=Paraburkholderia TaxID=1822464 RepID=UPI00211128BE|nr:MULTISPECIES: hypothetical protein [Paraburkholderia]MCP2087415.1 hypothetical protein [Paraburkholderia sediminicola]MCX4143224.1 hypothetical protein [Paraburkholderia aspalathi]MDN7175898.1 hypothetical protein [Paraburkholderia sp. SEWSISQ10-3 4]MDQ6505539.1 hypothetical protein [Paraburkholderia aspalathi]